MRWIPLPLTFSMALAATAGLAADAPLRPGQMRQAMGLKLGAWQTRFTVVDLKAELPPGSDAAEKERILAAFRAKLDEGRIKTECLWDEPDRLRLPGLKPPKDCDYSRLEARNGRFRIKSLCRAESGVTLEATAQGRYDPDHMTARSDVTSSDEGVRLRIKMDAESRFTGPCAPPPVMLTPPEKGD